VTSPLERRIALFIDFENLVTNTGITIPGFNLQPALDRLLEKGKVIFRRAYCDWSRFREAKGHLHEFGVELVDVPPSTRAGKNSADMRLVIDALELCYAREHIDTFVIASGDSDFCPLAYKLRENDKLVIGIGVRQSTSPLFVKACDEFIYLRGPDRAEPATAPRPSTAAGPRSAASSPPSLSADTGSTGKRPRIVPELVRQVVSSLLSRATAPLNPSIIKETVVRKQSDFDERDHGFSSFTRMLEAMAKEGLLALQQQGRQIYVVSPEAAPDKTSGDVASLENDDVIE
jgi:uncharacterized LabA/DUF88 family protein